MPQLVVFFFCHDLLFPRQPVGEVPNLKFLHDFMSWNDTKKAKTCIKNEPFLLFYQQSHVSSLKGYTANQGGLVICQISRLLNSPIVDHIG